MIKFNDKTLIKSKYYDKIKYFITDDDIKNNINSSTKIYTFAELDKFKTIYDLLNMNIDYCFILSCFWYISIYNSLILAFWNCILVELWIYVFLDTFPIYSIFVYIMASISR